MLMLIKKWLGQCRHKVSVTVIECCSDAVLLSITVPAAAAALSAVCTCRSINSLPHFVQVGETVIITR